MPSLTYKNREFLLEGKPYRILSGAIHYFRIVPQYWKDRLQRAKACGLNTIETYVPWNVHEPRPGVFTTEGILDLRGFIRTAMELDLKVIFRPGPYICSEWDFGGLPSWLLADPNMKVRSNYPGYMQAAERFLKWVVGQVLDLQHCNGGPIIAVQIENEYGNACTEPAHLLRVKEVLEHAGIQELLVTSDNAWGTCPSLHIPGVVPTANFQTVEDGNRIFEAIEKLDPDLPLMVMEFWTGWFDHWGSEHEERGWDVIEPSFKFILAKNASVNFYMFHGGTNFGFMAGANHFTSYKPDVTSYDYGAPLGENGKPNMKYYEIRDLIMGDLYAKNQFSPFEPIPRNPSTIKERKEIVLKEVLPWLQITEHVTKVTQCSVPTTMERVTFPYGDVQSYGYIIYRKVMENMTSMSNLDLPQYLRDRATVLVNGQIVATFDWKSDARSTTLPTPLPASYVLDIVVENLGRVNFCDRDQSGLFESQRKGIEGEVTLNGKPVQDWKIIALDFNGQFLYEVDNSDKWKKIEDESKFVSQAHPAIYRSKFEIGENPLDSFVKLEGFDKGVVLVNGFNLGRYWSVGPQQTLYLPGSILKEGQNEVMVFEENKSAKSISLEAHPELGSCLLSASGHKAKV